MKHTVVIVLVLFLMNFALSEERHANPANFHEIQNMSQSGDTILMSPGVYYPYCYSTYDCTLIDPNGREIVYKKEPNSIGEVILSGFVDGHIHYYSYFTPCKIVKGEGNGCQLIGLTIRCGWDPNEEGSVPHDDFGVICRYSSPLIIDCNFVGLNNSLGGISIIKPNGQLVIQNGHFTDCNGYDVSIIDSNYAGVCSEADVDIINSTFRGNQNIANGINISLCDNNSSVQISGCNFVGEMGVGNGISCDGINSINGLVEVNDCNISGHGGSGIFCLGVFGFNLLVTDCNITDCGESAIYTWNSDFQCIVRRCNLNNNNSSSEGGAIHFDEYRLFTVEDCNIIGNTSLSTGGGIMCRNALIKRSRIENNTSYLSGAGILGNYIDVNHCIISGNTAIGGNGGGLWIDQGNVINCVINRNKARDNGGGIWARDANILSSTICNNEVNGLGGGAYFASGPTNVKNCIFWGNTDTEDVPLGYQRRHQIYSGNADLVNLRNCDLQNTSADGHYVYDDLVSNESNIIGIDLEGNIDKNPLFMDNYHINSISPCIDSGDNNFVSWYFDIDDENRISEEIVDIGADEFSSEGPSLCESDYNDDGIINFYDFALFGDSWLTENAGISLDADVDVDIYDLKFFCECWLEEPD